MVTSSTGYVPGGSLVGTAPGVDAPDPDSKFWPLDKCRKAYTTYLDSKRLEIQEQQQARRYRHGVQWSSDQVKILNDRKQPVVTYNRIGRKIDGIVGLVERLKQDPKAYPRSPRNQQGADLATACLRYLMDANFWNDKSPLVSEACAIDGLAGIELDLKPRPLQPAPQIPQQTPQIPQTPQMPGMPPQIGGQIGGQTGGQIGGNVIPFPGMGHNGGPPLWQPPQPDFNVVFNVVDNDGFFYDPRSYKHDFSDARYLGMGKWVDEEMLLDLMPEHADLIRAGADQGIELTTSSAHDLRWFQSEGEFKQVRLIDVWYRHKRGWCWALFTGSAKLKEGRSPFKNEQDEEIAKYIMFSAAIDQDGDRYGFPRNLMSAQDEINQRRSKALHELSNRRIRATKAAVADGNVEAMRREAAKSDGIILSNTSLDDIQFDDMAKQAAVMGQLEFLKESKAEIENFGPNPAVLGDAGIGARSGRAIQMLQQAGIAELGPYMVNLRGWKIRVYRALFNAAQNYWTQERWIRITDSSDVPQFVQINGPDPTTGMPAATNAIGELDVDIILDEGPDSITIMQDTYETISQALPAVAKLLSPAQVSAAMEALIETSPLPADIKKKFRDAGAQQQDPPPEQQAAMAKLQLQQQSDAAKLQMEQQKGQAQLQLDAAKMQQDAQLKRESAAVDVQADREKAAMQMQIEREKADHQMQIEQMKAEQQVRLARDKTAADNEMEAQRMNFRSNQEQQIRQATGATQSPDDMLKTMMEAIGQSHQAMLAGLSKPRRAVIHRDPRTGKVIGAVSVTEE